MGFLRVVKLGGSLLGYALLKQRLEKWIETQPPASNLVLVGGGRLVDAVRQRQAALNQSDQEAHWAALDAMSLTAWQVHDLFPCWPVVDSHCPSAGDEAVTAIFDAARFMRNDVVCADPLPQDWTVTSDSIAARVAQRYGADELVLVKSVDLDESDCHAVDAHFGQVVPPELPVRWLNLRSGRCRRYAH